MGELNSRELREVMGRISRQTRNTDMLMIIDACEQLLRERAAVILPELSTPSVTLQSMPKADPVILQECPVCAAKREANRLRVGAHRAARKAKGGG